VSRKETYENRTWDLLLPIAEELGITPVDVEYLKEAGEYYLRVFIDKEGGVTIEDCETVTRELNPLLDREDYISEAYILEVSSPGLGRVIRRPRDFEYARGREVELHTYRPVNGKKDFIGILGEKAGKTVILETEEGPLSFDQGDISVIRLTFEI